MKTARTALDVSWGALAKVLVAAALVWAWLQVWQILMVIVIAIIMAVALHPVVCWLHRRGIPAGLAAFAVVLLLTAACAVMIAASWVTLRSESELIAQRLSELSQQMRTAFPITGAILPAPGEAAGDQRAGMSQLVVTLAQSIFAAAGMVVLALVLTVYLLIEWKATVEWLIAFVPQRHRGKVRRTLDEGRHTVFRYAVGNVFASTVTGVVTYFVLAALNIPAALVLAIVSGVLNLIPILGFLVSAVLASVLAVTVSANALVLVVAFYIVFNVVENYLITPKVFGHELALSDLAVLVAVIIGSALGGIMGAILALPIAAMYPPIERIWLRDRLASDTVDLHDRLSV